MVNYNLIDDTKNPIELTFMIKKIEVYFIISD